MNESRKATSPDDRSLLEELLAAKPPSSTGPRRAATLRSLNQQRNLALRGYRFRTLLDHILVRIERVLMVGIVVFFGFWLYNGYLSDWLYALRNPSTNVVLWDQLQPGASAAELDAALGQQLPVSASRSVPLAAQPDYLVPAQAFVVPPQPTPEPADPRPTRLIIPKLQVDSGVVEVFLQNGVWEVADYAVGYHHGTALPGTGNTVMAGHAGFRGGVFARLGELAVNDDLYIETAQTRYHYQITTIQSVWPQDVHVMYPTSEAQVTLITCTAWDTQRLVVTARLVDTAPLSSQTGGGESRESS